MHPPAPPKPMVERAFAALRGFALVAALACLAGFCVVAALRVAYPHELEWIEGFNLDVIAWIAGGNAPYGPPRVEFVPILYTPLYFTVAAALTRVFGDGFLAPRLLSILASLGCFWGLHRLVRRQTGDAAAGLVAAGLYAASWVLTGKWMDLAKVDSLFLLLVLAAFAAGRREAGPGDRPAGGARGAWRACLLPAALWTAAYFTKQLALPVAAALAVLSLPVRRGRDLRLWLCALLAGLACFGLAEALTGGWFSFFTGATFTKHPLTADIWEFWRLCARRLWPALLVVALHLALLARRRRAGAPATGAREDLHVLAFALALVLASWSVYLKQWTYLNGLMPACLGLALAAGVALGRLRAWSRPGADGASAATAGAARAALALALLLVPAQFALLLREPGRIVPSAADRAAADAFVERLARLDGDVLVFSHGAYARRAGKGPGLNSVALGDVAGNVRPGDARFGERQRQVAATLEGALAAQAFDWVVLDGPDASMLPWYLTVEHLALSGDEMYPVTGARMRPEFLLMANPVARGGRFPLGEPLLRDYLSGPWGEADARGRVLGTAAAAEAAGAVRLALAPGQGYRIVVGLAPVDVDVDGVDGAGAPVRVAAAWNGREVGEPLELGGARELAFDVDAGQVAAGLNVLDLMLSAARGGARALVTGLEMQPAGAGARPAGR